MREFKYDVVQLIQGIKDRPCLWDKTIDNYKDRVERRSAWEEIFNILEERYEEMTPEEKRLTGENILNKWTNIRDTFMKSLKTKLGRPKRRYVLYHHLKFLTKIRPEECAVDQSEFVNESNEEIPYQINMKEEIESLSPESSEVSYQPETNSKRMELDDTNSNEFIEKNVSQRKKSKRKEFDNLKSSTYTNECSSKKKSKRFTTELNDSKESSTKKKSKGETSKVINDIDPDNNDIDFVEVDEADNPRVMNEDEAFFASLLPTIVRYSEDERLEFRIEVLKVMKKIKDERKFFVD